MGYRFSGFFARAEPSLLEAAQRRWPGCRVRRIEAPFRGIGVASPEFDDADPDDEYERAADIADSIYADLPEWSRSHPGILFVYIDADCFGGHCEYEGYVCQDGRLRVRTHGEGALRRLMAFLGVDMDERLQFEPFLHGLFLEEAASSQDPGARTQ